MPFYRTYYAPYDYDDDYPVIYNNYPVYGGYYGRPYHHRDFYHHDGGRYDRRHR